MKKALILPLAGGEKQEKKCAASFPMENGSRIFDLRRGKHFGRAR
jgi:hypothetical protein